MQESVVIEERFRGPPQSGNGGFVGGTFAKFACAGEGEAQVTLRAPIPLDAPLQVNRSTDSITITRGDTLIAEVKRVDYDLEIPQPPSWQEAEQAASGSFSFSRNDNELFKGRIGFHPICFCCGAEHDDGLGVFAAPVGQQVAAIWKTKPEWADSEGNLPDEFLWTALDCPGQFAYRAQGILTGMLGRITAKVHRKAKAGETYMVTAWPIRVEGKKHFAGSAVFDAEGNLITEAITLWIGRRELSQVSVTQ
jgi:hypothetical protein